MTKHGDNRERRAHVREAAREGRTAGEAGRSTGAAKQEGHGDQEAQTEQLHREKGKT